MQLLQVLLTQSEGGAETFFEKIAIALRNDSAIQQRLIIEAHAKREERLKAAGCEYQSLSVGWLHKKTLYNPRLSYYAKSFKPEIVLTWMNRASRKAPKPKGSIKVARIGGYYPLKNYKDCDYLIVNTPELVGYMTNQGWPKDKITMISNFGEIPEDTAHGDDPRSQLKPGEKLIVTLGRLHKNKAQDTLLKALPQLPDYHLAIAGEGNLEEYLKGMCDELGITNRVHFLGWRRDSKFLFDSADLCVFPSREEALGNVVIEAWATQTPIIAANSAGPAWLIDHEKNGLLFDIDNVAQLVSCVQQLAGNQELESQMTANGLNKFESQFSKPVIVNQYKCFMKELLLAKKEKRSPDPKQWALCNEFEA